MNPIKYLTLVIISFLLVFSSACTKQNRLDLLRYKNRVLAERTKKNKFLKFSENSPIPATEKWQFTELKYFPVDLQYQVQAQYHPLTGEDELMIPTSSGQLRKYVKIGYFDFVLFDTRLKLMAYQEKAWLESGEQHALFVPFADQTTGLSTYETGRYLDIEISESSQAILDFNFAYNPYCAYSSNFSCPIPPPENNLPVQIEAGEKKYKEN